MGEGGAGTHREGRRTGGRGHEALAAVLQGPCREVATQWRGARRLAREGGLPRAKRGHQPRALRLVAAGGGQLRRGWRPNRAHRAAIARTPAGGEAVIEEAPVAEAPA